MKIIPAFAIALAFIFPAQAQSPTSQAPASQAPTLQTPLPKIIEDAVAANKTQCEDGQAVTFKPGFVTTRDINADGKPDYILNYEHFQCGEIITMFCGTGGCLMEIVASDDDGGFVNVWNENARRIRFATIKKRPAMLIDLHGSACGRFGAERCAMTLYWNGSKFHPAN